MLAVMHVWGLCLFLESRLTGESFRKLYDKHIPGFQIKLSLPDF